MSAVLPFPGAGFGPSANGRGSGILADLLANPIQFSAPIERSAYVKQEGVREVLPGPRSPKRGMATLNGQAGGKGAQKRDVKVEEEEESVEEGEERERIANEERVGQGKPPSSTHSSTPATTDSTSVASSSRLLATNGSTNSIASSSTLAGPSAPSTDAPSKSTGPTPNSPKKKAKSSSNADIDLGWPAAFARKGKGAGLVNPSMACYANASLQILLHTPPVLSQALGHLSEDCAMVRRKNGFCMLCALRKMAEYHFVKDRYRPSLVHNNLGAIRKGFKTSRQEDTHEFFRFVTDALQAQAQLALGIPKDAPEKVKQTTWIYDTWGGKIRSRVVCSRCNKPSDTFDSFLDLSLDVTKGGSPSLGKMLAGFIREDKLEGDNKYHCENCKAKANATKSFRIAKTPPVLTFTLKRFRINYNSYSGRPSANKYNGMIDYPEMLDIAPYMVDPQMPGTKYRLFGVTCHRGAELRFGHYTSFVKAPDGGWYNADDEDMDKVSLNTALNAHTAYLLSYMRVTDDEYAARAKGAGAIMGGAMGTPGGTDSRVTTPNTTPRKTLLTQTSGPNGGNKRKFEGQSPALGQDKPAKRFATEASANAAAGPSTAKPTIGWASTFTPAKRNSEDHEEGQIRTPESSDAENPDRFAPTGAPLTGPRFGASMPGQRKERDPAEIYAKTNGHQPRWSGAGERGGDDERERGRRDGERRGLSKKEIKKEKKEKARMRKKGAPQPYVYGNFGPGAGGGGGGGGRPGHGKKRVINGRMKPKFKGI